MAFKEVLFWTAERTSRLTIQVISSLSLVMIDIIPITIEFLRLRYK